MSTYSNVNVSSMKSTVSNAMRELANHSINKSSIYGSFTTSIITESAANKIRESLDKIQTSTGLNGSVATLNNKLSQLYSALDKIQSIQNAEADIKELEPKLYYWHDDGDYEEDEDGEKHWVSDWNKHLDTTVQNNINRLKSDITSYENEISSLLG